MYEKIYENNSKILEIVDIIATPTQYNTIFKLLQSSLYHFDTTYKSLEYNLTEKNKIQEELINDLVSKYNELNLQLKATYTELDKSEVTVNSLCNNLENARDHIDELTIELHDNSIADDINQLEQNLVSRLSNYISQQLTPEITQSIKKDLTHYLELELNQKYGLLEDKINKSLHQDKEVQFSKQKEKYADSLEKAQYEKYLQAEKEKNEEERKIFYIDVPDNSDVNNFIEKLKEKIKERIESGLISQQEFDNIAKLAKEASEKYSK